MCYFNERKTKNCNTDPKHTFKEVKLCQAARDAGNNIPCPQDTWVDMENVMKTTKSIMCATCNGLVYIIVEPEQASVAA
jgi:hypothetical protein